MHICSSLDRNSPIIQLKHIGTPGRGVFTYRDNPANFKGGIAVHVGIVFLYSFIASLLFA